MKKFLQLSQHFKLRLVTGYDVEMQKVVVTLSSGEWSVPFYLDPGMEDRFETYYLQPALEALCRSLAEQYPKRAGILKSIMEN